MQVLSAAFFLEFDEDGSGSVDRAEFRNNLWCAATEAMACVRLGVYLLGLYALWRVRPHRGPAPGRGYN